MGMEVVDYVDGEPTPGLLKLQALQKDMLREFLVYAESIGIECFLVAGSALGAVRHEDIIPWDDDVDLGVLRGDYERLLEAWEKRPLPGYFLQSERSDPDYDLDFAKLRKDGTVFKDAHVHAGGNYLGVFIDIFPYDKAGETLPALRKRARLLHFINYILLARTFSYGALSTDSKIIIGRKLLRYAAPLLPVRALKRWRRRLLTSEGYAEQGTGKVCSFPMYSPNLFARTLVEVSALLPTRPGRFGDLEVPLPNDCDSVLSAIFGDYMKLPRPEQRRPPHASLVDFGGE